MGACRKLYGMSGGHFTLDDLRSFVRGHGPEGEKLLLQHCRTCSECGDKLAGMLMLTTRAASRGRAETAKHMWIAAVAASVILLAALAVLLQTFVVDEPGVEEQLAALATTEPIPVFIVRFHLGSPTPMGNIPGVAPIEPRLLAAGEKLAAGDYAAAVRDLEQLRQDDPLSRLVAAYLGIARYLVGDDSARTGRLLEEGAATARTEDDVASSCLWYLGNLLLRRGRTPEAIEVFQDLADLPSRPGRQSLEILQKIEAAR